MTPSHLGVGLGFLSRGDVPGGAADVVACRSGRRPGGEGSTWAGLAVRMTGAAGGARLVLLEPLNPDDTLPGRDSCSLHFQKPQRDEATYSTSHGRRYFRQESTMVTSRPCSQTA